LSESSSEKLKTVIFHGPAWVVIVAIKVAALGLYTPGRNLPYYPRPVHRENAVKRDGAQGI
jgi:hypothetical protein